MPLTSKSGATTEFHELQGLLDQAGLEDSAKTARKLLSLDTPTQRLIGITDDGNRVYYFNSNANAIICLTLESPVAGQEGLVIAKLTAPSQLHPWVDKCAAYLKWTHPRFR